MPSFKYLNSENKYMFYEDGTVYSCITEKFMSPIFNKKTQRLAMTLIINGKKQKPCLHTIFYRLFIGEIEKGMIIGFKDGNPRNLKVSNLVPLLKSKGNVTDYDAEIWKPVLDYEEFYVANKEGEVMTLYNGKILEDNYSVKFEQSYKKHKLTGKDGKRTEYLCHLIIWRTFNGPIPEGMEIDHINRDKFDNRLENLRLVTKSEQQNNCVRTLTEYDVPETALDDNFVCVGKYKEYDFSKYMINEHGQMRKGTGRILKQDSNKGYKIAYPHDKITGAKKSVKVHQLVATVFIPNPDNLPSVRHKDGNRSNNHYTNLEWTTNRQITTAIQGRKVYQYNMDGSFVAEHSSIRGAYYNLGKKYGSHIRQVCLGNGVSAFKYKWSFDPPKETN